MRSVIVPTYNEERRILESLSEILKLENIELIVSDDGSTDGTVEISRNLSSKHENIRVLKGEHAGKGGALIRGLNKAQGSIIGFLDADLSAKPVELEKVLRAVEVDGADLAVGSRELPGSTLPIPQPVFRRTLGSVYSLLARLLLGVSIRDLQCGCKAMRKDVWDSIEVKSMGFVFDSELIGLAAKRGYKIKEVPIEWSNDRDSRVNPLYDPLMMFIGLLKVKWRIIKDG